MATLKPLPHLVTPNDKAVWESLQRLNNELIGDIEAESATLTGNLSSATITTGSVAASGGITAASMALGGNESFTYDEGTFTATLTGVSGSVTGTARFVRFGKAVTLYLPQLQGTSNATTCTITGVPASIRPARNQWVGITGIVDNTTTEFHGSLDIDSSGTINVWRKTAINGLESNSFTSSGTKGIYPFTVTYSLL